MQPSVIPPGATGVPAGLGKALRPEGVMLPHATQSSAWKQAAPPLGMMFVPMPVFVKSAVTASGGN